MEGVKEGAALSLSKRLAAYSTTLAFSDLPIEVVEFTKLCILDYFGSAVAGSGTKPVRMIAELAEDMGGTEQARLFTGGKSSALNAAMVNAAASHVVELDDIHKGSIIHAATVVIPAALAIAEWKELSGEELITAIVAGYEVCFRIGEAVSPSHYYYWHNTATCGTFGSAIAAAKLLKLNEEQTIAALGNAGTQAAGLWEFIEDGAMSKQLHTAKSSMNGVLAALLAKKGFTGPRKILEGDRGFFKAMSDVYDETRITEGLGEQFKIMENSFKIHASCRHTHHAVDMLIDIFKKRKPLLEEIESVKVESYQVALNITDDPDPQTEYAAKFSLQFCSALALLKGSASLADFNESSLWDEKVRALMKKVNVVKDAAIDASYPKKWGAAVEVVFYNGDSIRMTTEYPKGDPENAVTGQELHDKFMGMAADYSVEKKEWIARQVMNLENITNVEALMDNL